MLRRLGRAVLSLLAVVTLTGPAAAAAAAPAPLELVLTPKPQQGRLAVRMTLAAPDLAPGAGLVRLPLTLVGIPSARYDGDALQARDDLGGLPLVQAEEPPTPQGVYRRWSVTRPTKGDVVVTYEAPPRAVTAATNNGPLFDLRQEAGGFAGAGVGFLATPVADGPWKVRLRWDLSASPPGSRGAWTYGEGPVEIVLPSQALSFSYYAAGPLKSHPPDPKGFSLYWLGEPPFDAPALGARIESLFKPMSAFFGDEGGAYRVFMRQNPYKGMGGSALGRSFMFGYHPPARPGIDDLQGLIAHEMAHNWPRMQGEHGETAWYSEGMAEYYSVLLSHRAGLLPPDRLLKTLNDKAAAYYSNPYRDLSNVEGAKRFWTDPIAQTIPYGRGFFYLLNTDAAIREASGGRRSLDDVAKAMRRRDVAGQTYGLADWLALVGAEIGVERARRDYERMAAGGLLVPAPRFAPCFKVTPRASRAFELGFARASLNDDRVVRGLQPGSAAAEAGLREGDVLTEVGDIDAVRKDETAPLRLVVGRGGESRTITYLPRGPAREGYAFARDPAAPAESCQF
ncbi:PDZ domain-containing protein [Phenylobacterium sp.]|uniref:PDZ domain-containing protein n=1 Tax=Phenylobacterium sp. TaxID=1871053 RepID=UPI0035B460F7